MSDFTESDVRTRIEGLDDETAKKVVCGMVGHSRIETTCFGYHYCARCGAQTGDSLASIYPEAASKLVVGHNCDVCRENAKALTWKDTMLAPDPFPVPEREMGEVG